MRTDKGDDELKVVYAVRVSLGGNGVSFRPIISNGLDASFRLDGDSTRHDLYITIPEKCLQRLGPVDVVILSRNQVAISDEPMEGDE